MQRHRLFTLRKHPRSDAGVFFFENFLKKIWRLQKYFLSLHRSNSIGAEDVAPQGGYFYATNIKK